MADSLPCLAGSFAQAAKPNLYPVKQAAKTNIPEVLNNKILKGMNDSKNFKNIPETYKNKIPKVMNDPKDLKYISALCVANSLPQTAEPLE
ncbi:MAG: hypothetical protein LBF79_03135 [Dysgonamonadaceae bacterium]|nr:hypothetical protein [Dysgonamonadaceae bacterium]